MYYVHYVFHGAEVVAFFQDVLGELRLVVSVFKVPVMFVLCCHYMKWYVLVEFVFMYLCIALCIDDRIIILIGAELILTDYSFTLFKFTEG